MSEPATEEARVTLGEPAEDEGERRPRSVPPPSVRAGSGGTLGARLLPNVFAGVISATLVISFGISLAALIFRDRLAPYLPAGIGAVLASSFLVGAAVSLTSSFRPAIAAPQENTAVILAAIAASIADATPEGVSPLPTVIAAIGVATIATGLLFLALGSLRLGKIVRFIPYPVVGGFLGGTGFLLVRGALSVMSGLAVTVDQALAVFAPRVLVTWAPGVAFGVALVVILRRWRHFLILPGMVVGGIALFYAAVLVAGVGPSGAMARGWLLGPFPAGALWPPVPPAAIAEVRWSFLWADAGNMVACTILAGISILINATGLELATERDLDLDRELTATGVANLVTGLLGGPPGYLLLSESTLNHKVGARSRAAGLISASLCLTALVAGTAALAYFPKPVLGGLLFFLGVTFLIETVYDAWFRLPRVEYALVIVIMIAVVVAGFLVGVGVGIVVSSVLFAVNYARIDVVKHAISGASLRSKAGRSPGDEARLKELGARIHVMQLQGYVFFGTAYQLLQRVKERLSSGGPLPVYFVVLDFRHVDGIDSSAVVSFARMRKLAEGQGAVLVLTELPASVRRQLERGGCIDRDLADDAARDARSCRVFSDLDHGLEWCETQVLEASGRGPGEALRHHDLVQSLRSYLERVEAPAGSELYRKGDVSDDLYLIESGELEAWLELEGGRSMRLRTMGAGSVVGESGLYLGQRRSANVRTTRPSVLYRLSSQALARMTEEAPALAAAFHQLVARLLADRMVNTTSAAQMLFY